MRSLILFFSGKLEQNVSIIEAVSGFLIAFDDVTAARLFFENLLSALVVAPKRWGRGLFLELFYAVIVFINVKDASVKRLNVAANLSILLEAL